MRGHVTWTRSRAMTYRPVFDFEFTPNVDDPSTFHEPQRLVCRAFSGSTHFIITSRVPLHHDFKYKSEVVNTTSRVLFILLQIPSFKYVYFKYYFQASRVPKL